MKVGMRLGVCNNPPAYLLYCECARRLVTPNHHNPSSTYYKARTAKPGENGLNGWQFRCATSSMHKKRNLLWNNKLVKQGQNWGSSSRWHTKLCTACAWRERHVREPFPLAPAPPPPLSDSSVPLPSQGPPSVTSSLAPSLAPPSPMPK